VSCTVPPSAEIEAQIDRLLAVGVGENPRESLSELARLGARLIIQRAVDDESTPGLAARAMSVGQRISAGYATTGANCATGFVRVSVVLRFGPAERLGSF
jgi:hypothetical protein